MLYGRKPAATRFRCYAPTGAPLKSLILPMPYDRNIAIARSFEARAEAYELHADLQRSIADRLALLLPPIEAPRVLELGCGTGLLSRHLIAQYPDGDFVFTDLAKTMLEQCRLNIGVRARGRARFTQMDGNQADAALSSFDLIATSMALHWLSDPLASLAKLRSLLAPNGVLLFAALGPESFIEWRKALDAEGLPNGVITTPSLPGIVAEERSIVDASTLAFLRRMKRVGGITPREGYAKLSAGQLRHAIRECDAKCGGRITWHIVYGRLGAL
jgi:malonyl-CoA O-methyltransferase